MNRISSRQSWFLIVAAALVVSAGLGLLLRQDQVVGQDRSAPTTIRTPSTSLSGFCWSISATLRISSGWCCPSASAVTTPPQDGK